jgi:hypothetical protein
LASLCLGGLLFLPARADENADLNLIPGTVGQEPANPAAEGGTGAAPAATPTPSGKIYIEDAFTVESLRSPLAVPLPPSSTPAMDIQNRTSLDFTRKWTLDPDLDFSFSDRANLYVENDIAIPSHQDFRNDFREGFVTWEPAAQTYLEAGRINVRHGTALGYNPTDFFKARSLVDQASEDPSVIGLDRLGVAMARAQHIFADGSVSLAVAPRLAPPTAIPASGSPPSVDPGFGRTNGINRVLLSGSYEVADGVSPEFLAYHDDDGTRFGANVSRTIGQAIVAYGEWSGGEQSSLSSRAIQFGKQTHTLPAAVPDPDSAKSFTNDAAVGASWTDGADEITINLEYHYHQSGFGSTDWRHWFAKGAAGNPQTDSLLWYTRAFASDQQEPMTRQEFFVRADWQDAFINKLEISAIAFIDAYDGSTLTQLSVGYSLSDNWSVSALGGASLGASRSERGSLPEQASAIALLTRYF